MTKFKKESSLGLPVWLTTKRGVPTVAQWVKKPTVVAQVTVDM